ncbi:MAG TPA: hypothetical protein VNL92_02660, partial [Dehalococcoidia bacterium]|nr:hypothetical protein [Dehalococcoidia bacterium]
TATVPWLRTDPPAGVALGADVACAPGAACDRTATVEIVIDEGELERGSNEAELQVWSLQQPGVMVSIPVSVSSTGPPPRPSPSPTATSIGTPSPNDTPSPTPPAPSERTDVVAAELVAGCNPIGSAFPDGTPVAEVLASVEPDSVVTAVWRLPQPEGPWELFIPGQDAVSTLDTVNAHDGLFICTEGRTVVSQTIVIEGSGERTTMLQPGCNFVAAARASTSAAFLGHVVPEDGVLALWWLDAREGHWLVYLPPAPPASSLDRVDRLAGVFVCMERQGELRQLDLVP